MARRGTQIRGITLSSWYLLNSLLLVVSIWFWIKWNKRYLKLYRTKLKQFRIVFRMHQHEYFWAERSPKSKGLAFNIWYTLMFWTQLSSKHIYQKMAFYIYSSISSVLYGWRVPMGIFLFLYMGSITLIFFTLFQYFVDPMSSGQGILTSFFFSVTSCVWMWHILFL